MIEATTGRDVAALSEAANAIAPMSMFGTLRRGTDNRIVMRYWRPKGFGAHRFDEPELPDLLLPEATGWLQASADELRSPATTALDAILSFSDLPLRITVIAGGLVTFVGIVMSRCTTKALQLPSRTLA